jgi:hypothetical protein
VSISAGIRQFNFFSGEEELATFPLEFSSNRRVLKMARVGYPVASVGEAPQNIALRRDFEPSVNLASYVF